MKRIEFKRKCLYLLYLSKKGGITGEELQRELPEPMSERGQVNVLCPTPAYTAP